MGKLMRRLGFGLAAGSMPLLFAPVAQADHGVDPAGGAAIADIVLATAGAVVLTSVLFAIGFAHRTGRIRFLARAGAWSERKFGIPAWAALPGLISSGALLVALLGMYWDISLHIDQGRDPGPLANPGHYLILGGLFGCFVAGFISIVLPSERPGRSAVRITRSWYAPVGGLMLLACGAFSLMGFPLDDAWHRLFGQDVTLWGPTHLMLIGGAAMTLIGRSVLLVEGARAARDNAHGFEGDHSTFFWRFQRASMVGAFLIGLSTFQAEFDFGVPQFRFLFEPAMIMLAAGVSLVTARIWAGPGGALMAVGLFVVIRGGVSLLVGPVFGEVTPHFPLYIVEAGIVELVGLAAAGTFARRQPLAFGAICGVLIGSVGLAAEWGWSELWMPLPWPESLLPEGVVVGMLAAIAGSTIGALIGAALASDRVRRPRGSAFALAAAGVAVAAIIGYGLQTSSTPGQSAHITLTETDSAPQRTVSARIELEPRSAADNAHWLTVTAWQGGKLVLDPLERIERGVYRTTRPIPVSGEWKSVIRLNRGDSLQAVPIYLPNDPAIPATEVPARSGTRQFVTDKQVLQREAKSSSPALVTAAHLAVLSITLGLLALLGWGLRRLALDGRAGWRRDPKGPRVKATRTVMPASS